MKRNHRRLRVALLVAVHLLLGNALLFLLSYNLGPRFASSFAIALQVLASTQVVLIGLWGGLSEIRWWMKVLGLLLGTAWIVALVELPFHGLNVNRLVQLAWPIPLMIGGIWGIAAVGVLARWGLVQIIYVDPLSTLPIQKLQYSLRWLIGLTVFAALLLGFLDFCRSQLRGPFEVPILVSQFIVISSITAFLTMWICLAPRQMLTRLAIALLGLLGLGLALAAYAPARSLLLKSVAYPVTLGFSVAVSLFVIRSCGYRLVSHRQASAIEMARPEALP